MGTNVALDKGAAYKNLGLATWAFTISFWAWNLIGPLSKTYNETLDMSPVQWSVVVAMPVLVGSVGRIPVGALTDRFGGRLMFTVLCVVSIAPVLLVMWAQNLASYPLLLLFAFFLGIAGTTFAVGIPFANAWFQPSKRGMATGIFGAGMGGTALSALFTPRMVDWFGYNATHIIIAIALGLTALLVWSQMRNSPAWSPNNDPVTPKLVAAAKLPVTWQLSALYAMTFGGFVAFSTYLPTYLQVIYEFDPTQAGTRTSGFAIAAVVARPIGGILSDRFHPRPVIMVSLAGAAVMGLVVATQPAPELAAGASFVALAFFLGIGTGAVFAWVALRTPVQRVGSVTGIVGAAGGLGGYFPPMVMGATYNEEQNSYTIGLVLMVITALIVLAYVVFGMRREKTPPEGAR